VAPPTAKSTPLEAPAPPKVVFRVTLSPSLGDKPASGRLLVLAEPANDANANKDLGASPGQGFVAGVEVPSFPPGATITVDPDDLVFPSPFSRAPAGAYRFMAVLDRDHSFIRTGPNQGDLKTPVRTQSLDPARSAPVELALDTAIPARALPPLPEGVEALATPSALLSAFWGKPITVDATVVLPPSYARDGKKKYPTVYWISGYGGDNDKTRNAVGPLVEAMRSGAFPEMVYVLLGGMVPTGHCAFADSANNGPWSRAFVEELLPAIEARYRVLAKPSSRFLTGHSSGGWASLWAQVAHPDTFGGTWSTAPDPVDFRRFAGGVDVTQTSTENAYFTEDLQPRAMWREGDKTVMSMEEAVLFERVHGDYGGPLSTFEWVFSPRADDGRPMRLFDRKTGVLDPNVARAWERFDIRKKLEREWDTLGPKLEGKLHVITGGADSFRLEEATKLLCDFLQEKKAKATCEIVPGKTHGDLRNKDLAREGGLSLRIAREMAEAAAHPPASAPNVVAPRAQRDSRRTPQAAQK
jgi:S-formylglutathione hydrolase FrmB